MDQNGNDRSSNGIDDDGNGYVDDHRGYDFATDTAAVKDESGHGTHVAGIVAADHGFTGPDKYPKGVAPKTKILPVDFMNSTRGGLTSDAIEGLRYAQKRGANVVNASWGGGPCSDLLHQAIMDLQKHDILFVSASGNRGNNIDYLLEYPASYNLVHQITVGMITPRLGMDRASNYGTESVHIFAPGRDILSALPNASMGYSTGTSMASPFVAGAVALLKSYRSEATGQQIRQAIMDSATRDRGYLNASEGRLHLYNALQQLDMILGY